MTLLVGSLGKAMARSRAFQVGRFLAVALILGGMTEAFGEWADTTTPVPVERLVRNANRIIEESPKDFRGHYVLGRLHSLAFAKQEETLRVILDPAAGEAALPDFAPWESIMVRRSWDRGELEESVRSHLEASIRSFRKASELDDSQAHVFLGLGWVLEEGSRWAPSIGAPPGRSAPELSEDERKRFEKAADELASKSKRAHAELEASIDRALWIVLERARQGADDLVRRAWLNDAAAAYRRAYALAVKRDLAAESFGEGMHESIAFEAGQGMIRILDGRKRTGAEEEELKRVRKAVSELEKKPRWVTPIILAPRGGLSLSELLDPRAATGFDLDGDGEPCRWPWVGPDTEILVWDPLGSGRIRSGLQLFGSVTWWIFWEHGYQPLDLLDDDRDGRLAGSELNGLAVWTDRDQDGVSDPGEVAPLRECGIEAIEVRPAGLSEGVPHHPRGIRMRGGATRPSYDWTPQRIDEAG